MENLLVSLLPHRRVAVLAELSVAFRLHGRNFIITTSAAVPPKVAAAGLHCCGRPNIRPAHAQVRDALTGIPRAHLNYPTGSAPLRRSPAGSNPPPVAVCVCPGSSKLDQGLVHRCGPLRENRLALELLC